MSDIPGMMLDFAHTSKALSKDESRKCAKLAEVLKASLDNKARKIIGDNLERPVLYHYSSDGTPMTVVQRFSDEMPGKRIKREGGALHELLVQRGFVGVMKDDGSKEMAVLMAQPLPLDKGKGAWNLYSAAKNFFPLLREAGHRGIAVSHYGFDRALFDSLSKKMRQRHELHHHQLGVAGSAHASLLGLTDWVLATGCGNHDCQNGLKWGCKEILEDPKSTLKDLYIVLEALRNGFSALHDHLRVWLLKVVRFSQGKCDKETVSIYWRSLGVEADFVELLAELNLHWKDGALWVNAAAQGDSDLMEKVSGVVLYLFKFRRFTESRWTTLGEASRGLACALSVGLEGLVTYIRGLPEVSDWHLQGFARLTPEAKGFVLRAAVASFVPDSVLVALLEDDRVAGRLAELETVLSEEHAWLSHLPTPFWKRLAELGDEAPTALRSDAVRVATIAAGYINNKIFKVARDYPWRLAVGDVEANLAHLEAEENISDPVALKVQKLVRLGFNKEALLSGVLLFREMPWSTTAVEQGHGSAATIHRLHSRYGLAQLCSRSLVHMARPLIEQTGDERKALKLQKKTQKLLNKVPQRVSGRHMFLRDMVLEAKQLLPDGVPLPHATRMALVSKHADMFKRLSRGAQEVYNKAADRHASVAAVQIASEVQRLESDEALRRSRMSAESVAEGLSMRLSNCRFTPADLVDLEKAWVSNDFCGGALAAKQRESLNPPAVPNPIEQTLLAEMSTLCNADQPMPPLAPWAKLVCRNRDVMKDCALAFQSGERIDYYYFVLASQSPEFVILSELQPVNNAIPVVRGHLSTVFTCQSLYTRFKFRLDPLSYTLHQDVPVTEDTIVKVLPHCFFLRQGCVGSDADLLAVADYLPPAPRGVVSSSRRSAVAAPGPTLIADHPWLQAHLAARQGQRGSQGQSSSDRAPRVRDPEAKPALDDEAAEQAFVALEQKRQEWASAPVASQPDFVTKIRGGAWTMAHTGKVADSVRAECRGQEAKEWCTLHGLPKSATFAFNRYSETGAGVLAREWCRRMQFWYDILGTASASAMRRIADEAEVPEEPEEFAQLMRAASNEGPTFERGTALRNLKPYFA